MSSIIYIKEWRFIWWEGSGKVGVDGKQIEINHCGVIITPNCYAIETNSLRSDGYTNTHISFVMEQVAPIIQLSI